MSLKEFNGKIGKELGLTNFDWQKYFLAVVEPMPEMDKLVKWTAAHYQIGLLSNALPGSIEQLRQKGLIPDVAYTAIVDSSKVGAIKPEPKIYEISEQLAATAPKEILLIDDSRANLTAADRRGWHVLWFDDYHPSESIERIKQSLEF